MNLQHLASFFPCSLLRARKKEHFSGPFQPGQSSFLYPSHGYRLQKDPIPLLFPLRLRQLPPRTHPENQKKSGLLFPHVYKMPMQECTDKFYVLFISVSTFLSIQHISVHFVDYKSFLYYNSIIRNKQLTVLFFEYYHQFRCYFSLTRQ